MLNWIKSLFSKKEDVKVEEKPKASPQPTEFHIDRANITKKKSKALPDFNTMTKAQIDEWAKKNLGLNLDRRKKKDYMIEQIQTKLKEK